MKDLRRLLRHLAPYKNYVGLNILFNILMALFTVVSIPVFIPFFRILFGMEAPVTSRPDGIHSIGDVIDWANFQFSRIIEEQGAAQALLLTCIVLVSMFFLKNLFRYLSMYFIAPVRNGIVRDIRQEIFDRMTILPLGYFSEERKGDLMSRIVADVQEIEWSILNVLEAVFRSPVTIAGSLFIMIYMSPGLTLVIFILMIFSGVIIGGISSRLRRQSGELQDILGVLVSTVEETLGGLRVIKAFRAERFQQGLFRKVNEQYRDTQTRIIRRRDLSSPLSEFLGITVVAILLWFGAQRIFAGEIGAESFMAFLLAFYNVIEPSKSLTNAYYNIQKGLAAVDRVDKILDAPGGMPEIDMPKRIQQMQEGLRFEKVSFTYPQAEQPALVDIDFFLPKGKTLALVGLSGAGKSTIADLIPRFYDVSAGRITIDGTDLREARVEDIRGLLGIVTQEAILFHESIRNNITFGLEATDEQVTEAARLAHAAEFIDQLPGGYDFNIGDRGGKLSGGQRQRLTIARALLCNPQLLILDEATSALDSESERLVQEALDVLLADRTALVIAHRLSTIRRADEILVLREGSVVERGTHDELIARKGEYSKLVDLQGLG
ncbi:MAG: ABC transporter ATP-binding protein [Lewinellaceae bacterium]|nr:ABC transporter ATP-binding protein [Lewinellaceae bacterium]HRW75700.1 ABC transporter ATP-binding protein [Saprospiraceae bacterium]